MSSEGLKNFLISRGNEIRTLSSLTSDKVRHIAPISLSVVYKALIMFHATDLLSSRRSLGHNIDITLKSFSHFEPVKMNSTAALTLLSVYTRS